MSMLLKKTASATIVGRRPAAPRRSVVARNQPEGKNFNLDNSRQAGVGFMEKDSAGQTNIFPSMTGAYEQGSSADKAADNGANALYAVAATGVAGGLVALGVLSGLGAQAPVAGYDFSTDLAQYSSVGIYAAKFDAELKAPPPAPPLE